MKHGVMKKIKDHRRGFFFVLIGCQGLIVDIGTFYFLTTAGMYLLLANFFSISCSLTHNFWLNALFNFKTHDRLLRRYASYYGIGMVGVGFTSVILWFFVTQLGYHELLVKITATVSVVAVQYQLHKIITFARHHQSPEVTTKETSPLSESILS